MKIIYHPKLIFGSRFLNRFHPFEFDRAAKALELIREELGLSLEERIMRPQKILEKEALELVHDRKYLQSLKQTWTIVEVIETPLIYFFPKSWVQSWFVEPALWSVAASLMGARAALKEGLAFVLGGGFHHAKRQGGEGFCLVNDIAFVIETLRSEEVLKSSDEVLYIDLDVHQGNGVSDYYGDDPNVKILDAYNGDIYPVYGKKSPDHIDVPVVFESGCGDEEYIAETKQALDKLLSTTNEPKLLIYNAGTDIFEEDRLGGLKISHRGVNTRDALVLNFAMTNRIPMLVLASGGYSKTSAKLLADFIVMSYRAQDQGPS